IAKIITSKLRSLLPASEGTPSSSQESNPTPVDFTPFLHPAAIQLCARKVASTTGDLRKAFELARRAIELIERETMQKRAAMTAEASTTSGAGVPEPGSPSHRAAATTHAKVPLEENANLATRTSVNSKFVSPPDTPGTTATSTNKSAQVPSLPVLTPATAPRATVAHVARVTASLLGTGTTERLAGLTLQQKAALCALVALGKKNAAAAGDDKPVPRTPSKRSSSSSAYKATPSSTSAAQAPTIKALFATYVSLCRRDNALAPLSSSEFNDVVSSLETSGLVSLQSHGSGPASRSRSGSGPSMPSTPSRTPSRRGRAGAARDNGETVVTCHVNEKEVLDGLVGAGEGVLRKLVAEEN
ncbi:AAA ATPase, partial [Ascosphaera atra]